MSLKVLMVSDVFFPRINGVSTSIQTFRRTLGRHGVETRIVAPSYAPGEDVDGIVRVAGRRVPRDPEDRLASWRAIRDAVHAEAGNADLIHIQTPFMAHYAGVRAARARRLPTLSTYHTLFEEYLRHYAPFVPANWLRAAARRLSRAQCNAVDAVVVPSSAMRQRLGEYGVSAPMHVLPTGIPLDQFRHGDRARFRSRHGIPAEQPVALYVGRVAFEKNLDFLLDAFALARQRRPDLLLLVTGEGPALPDLRRQAERLGLAASVRFLGYMDREGELPDCYAAADVFTFCSRTETQGLVLLEAMALGLPAVALAAMGTCDILGPGRGCLAPADDRQAFADALLQVIDHPELRQRLSAEARAYAGEWSDDAMAARLAGLYHQLKAAA
jgi:glycosyltransferase involved in cell wall biosynthesis